MNLARLSHRHRRRDGPLDRAPAGIKLACALGLIVGTVIVPPGWTAWYVAVAALLVLAIVVGRVSPTFLAVRLVLLSPLVLGVALAGALRAGAGPGWAIVGMKSGLCLVVVLVTAQVTPFRETLRVLRRLRVPGLLVTTLALMHRYLFVLADEAERMSRARASRTFVRGRQFTWAALSTVGGQLFVRASERAERIYAAMCARGWR